MQEKLAELSAQRSVKSPKCANITVCTEIWKHREAAIKPVWGVKYGPLFR